MNIHNECTQDTTQLTRTTAMKYARKIATLNGKIRSAENRGWTDEVKTLKASLLILRTKRIAEKINAFSRQCQGQLQLIDQYNENKEKLTSLNLWVFYCEKHGFDTSHDGFDCAA